MEGKEVSKAIMGSAEAKLASLKESIERNSKEAGVVVDQARTELSAIEEALQAGASKTFLGASVMLVGVTEYPLQKPFSECREGRMLELLFDGGSGSRVRLHGDPEALMKLAGRYKAIVLLYKSD